jgi:ElaA protein
MTDLISRRFDELTGRELHDIAQLRSEVFVVEQECVYLDLDGRDTEPGAGHHWIEVDGLIASYARTLTEPGGAVRIGRVVTAPAVRGRGLAAAVMAALVEQFGAAALVLEAQSHLAGWYVRFGFAVAGEEYLEDGIPHLTMRRAPG